MLVKQNEIGKFVHPNMIVNLRHFQNEDKGKSCEASKD
jgi:hypothetical protein